MISSYLWFDVGPTNAVRRFYRAVALPYEGLISSPEPVSQGQLDPEVFPISLEGEFGAQYQVEWPTDLIAGTAPAIDQ